MFIVPLNRGDKMESFNISKKEEKKTFQEPGNLGILNNVTNVTHLQPLGISRDTTPTALTFHFIFLY